MIVVASWLLHIDNDCTVITQEDRPWHDSQSMVIAQLSQNDVYYLDARATHGAVRRKDRLAPTGEDRLRESAQIVYRR